jgi:hypothetical protein
MKPYELFLGALCLYDTGEGKELNVIDAEDIVYISEMPIKAGQNYSPIPLTPAVVQCIEGWIKYDWFMETQIPTNPKILLWIDTDNAKVYICFQDNISDDQDERLPHIKHLHQLQHLYLALTGEDMKIDIDKLKQAT